MKALGAVLLTAISMPLLSLSAPAVANDGHRCEAVTNPWGVTLVCDDPTSGTAGGSGDGPPNGPAAPVANSYYQYAWAPACPSNVPQGDTVPQEECANFQSCPNPNQFMWALWSRLIKMTQGGPTEGPWSLIETTCQRQKPSDAPSEVVIPEVTWQMVLTEIRRVGLPAMTVQVQPAGQTLVNFDTIFYTEPSTFARTLEILGRVVEVEARPSRFLWTYGDGRSQITTTPGAPYPAKTIVHRYRDAHVTVHPRVDVVYTAQFRVDGGEWQDIPETITIPGPSVDLRIREATPVLSGAGR